MKRTMLSLILVLALCLSLVCPVAAQQLLIAPKPVPSSLVDEADLLTDSEEEELLQTLEAIEQAYQVQVVVMTVDGLGGYSPDGFINYIYDSQGYGCGVSRDGVLLVVDMDSRTYRILSNGLAADAITMDAIDSIGYAIESDLSDGDYADAFETFAEECEYYIDGHINGFPYKFGTNLVIALVVGFVVALIVTGIMRGQLKSVHHKATAQDYMKRGSLKLTGSSDIFLYRNVSRTAKPKSNSGSGGGSSGGSRNVGGGRF